MEGKWSGVVFGQIGFQLANRCPGKPGAFGDVAASKFRSARGTYRVNQRFVRRMLLAQTASFSREILAL
jgi:hypothetical protein